MRFYSMLYTLQNPENLYFSIKDNKSNICTIYQFFKKNNFEFQVHYFNTIFSEENFSNNLY